MRFTLAISSSHSFGSTPHNIRHIVPAPFRTRFRCGSACHWLNLTTEGNSPARSTKSTPSLCLGGLAPTLHRALTACKRMVSGSISFPSRGAFHLSLTVLVRYRSLGYLALESGLPSFPPGSSCLVVLKLGTAVLSPFGYGTLTPYGRPFQARSPRRNFCNCSGLPLCPCAAFNPLYATSRSIIHVQSLGSSRFVRHYYGNCLFSSGYLDVSVPPLASLH